MFIKVTRADNGRECRQLFGAGGVVNYFPPNKDDEMPKGTGTILFLQSGEYMAVKEKVAAIDRALGIIGKPDAPVLSILG